MPSLIQRSFAGGEVAPALYGRADQVKYQTGLRTCRNFFVRRHGGVSNRPGTQYIATAKDSTKRGRLLKFVFNDDQTYVLWFEHLSMRVVRNRALVLVSGVPAWSAATAYVIGDLASRLGVNYYCILGHTNQQPPNATYWYALTGSIYEIPTPYVEADLPTLQTSQSGDIVTITHQNYAPRDLARTGHTAWTLTAVITAPSIAAPASPAVAGGTGTGKDWIYKITAIKEETFEESEPSASATLTNKGDPTAANPNVVTWSSVTGAQDYNVYRQKAIPTATTGDGIYGFVGTAAGTTFNDTGAVTPDMTDTPPIARSLFATSGNYPATSGYFQQRKMYASSINEPEKVWGSRSGSFKNFTIRSPLQDDDAVTFTPVGRKVNAVRHMIEVDDFILLTSGGEWIIQGDANGVLVPQSPNPKQKVYYGAAEVAPVIVGNSLIYVQARGSIVRDFRKDLVEGSKSKDLSIFAPHLFEGVTIEHLDYAQVPHSIVWATRADGVAIGLTYLPDHDVWGWAPQVTDGSYEDICVVPEGDEDALYWLVKRTINGATTRALERSASRTITNVVTDALFLDSFLTYDGRNTGATTMTLSGGTNWTYGETLTLTASAGYFVAGDVGNVMVLDMVDANGVVTDSIRLTIGAYSSATVVTGLADKTVPVGLRAVAKTTWGKAVDDFSGATHLEGKAIGILADGAVVTNGVDTPVTTVSAGAFAISRPAVVVHAGLPITADFETLDLELVGTETLLDKQKLVKSVTLFVEASRGIWAGLDANHLTEYKQRTTAVFNPVMPVTTGKPEIIMASKWDSAGRVFVRQKDPLPLTILSIMPHIELGG